MSTLEKGVIYNGINDAAIPQGVRKAWDRLRASDEARQAWVDTHNARSAIAGECPRCSRPLVEEERRNHAMQCADPDVRHLVRMIAELRPERALNLFDHFNLTTGDLNVPPVPEPGKRRH